jgi:beta-glucanase (GH16 family)
MVWHDEFDKDGPPDPANWDFEHGFVRNQELQWYQPENAFCKDGMLVIEARRESKPNPTYDPNSKYWGARRPTIEYTSACLITKHKQEFTFGRIEMRARIDTRSGSWPAFWTLGSNISEVGWPKCGEIDIMEYYRTNVLANVCEGEDGNQHWLTTRKPLDQLGGEAWSKNFHVWTMEWDDRKIDLLLDGELRAHYSIGMHDSFRKPLYILLNQAIGGQNGGDPSKTEFPVRMEVDWIRVYQRSSAQAIMR